MVLAWFGWSVSSWGYCLLKGYDVKFTDWINPVHPYEGWPPPQMPADQIIPGGTSGTSGTAATGKASTGDVVGAGVSAGLKQAGLP
jgi:hypothetical protein